MDDEAPVARYDAAAGTLRVRLAGGEEVAIGGLGADLAFWRGGDEEPVSVPIWVSAEQADYLNKMINYILARVPVSPGAKDALQQLSPQVAQVKDELEAAAAGNGALPDVESMAD